MDFFQKNTTIFERKCQRKQQERFKWVQYSYSVLGLGPKNGIFTIFLQITRYYTNLGPFFTQNHKIWSKIDQIKWCPNGVNTASNPAKVYSSWVSARAQIVSPTGRKASLHPYVLQKGPKHYQTPHWDI